MKLVKGLANLGYGSRKQVALMFREGRVTDADGRSFRYNQPDVRHRRGVLYSAGHHHAALVAVAQRCFPA